MAAAANIVDLRRLLAERFPRAQVRRPVPAPPVHPTRLPALDNLLGGGLAEGSITELVGKGNGSGSAQVLHAVLHAVAQSGRFTALVDGADSFDVDAALPEVLARMLWVRCAGAGEALKAADLLLRDRNLPLVILDLKPVRTRELQRVPSNLWFRFSRLVEHHGTTLLVITPHALVGAADVRVRVDGGMDLERVAAGPEAVAAGLRFELLRQETGVFEGTLAGTA
ncbi:MAG: hypothetical protein KF791_07955 [Verrucomicrobiae bacterium]|nr:hypothetical protein [Verrucomicrobiae bacterium]